MPASVVDIEPILDNQRLTRGAVATVAVLAVIMLVDGYDLSLLGILIPHIAADLHVAPADLTGSIVFQQFGLLVGALMMGPLSDRFGRRLILIVCMAALAALTALIAAATTPPQLMAARGISAIFFAGIIPNCITLALEGAPKRLRATAVTIVFAGYSTGPVASSGALLWVVGAVGWRGAFYLAAALVLALIPLVLLAVPESIRFRVIRDTADRSVGRDLVRLDPALAIGPDTVFTCQEREMSKPGSSLALLRNPLLPASVLIALCYLTLFAANQMTANWMTTILIQGGHLDLVAVARIVFITNFAAVPGTLLAGLISDRVGVRPTLVCALILYTSQVLLVSIVDLGSTAALIVFFAYGGLSGVALVALNAMAASSFPGWARVTAVAWGSGIGRIGGMIGPAIGGAILRSDSLPPAAIFAVAALPAALAAIFVIAFGRYARRTPLLDA